MRFANEPPYSSSRVLLAGDRNCSIRYPDDAWMSMPSRPPSRQRHAASANASTISAMSATLISVGMPPTIGLGIGLDDTCVAAFFGRVAEPGW